MRHFLLLCLLMALTASEPARAQPSDLTITVDATALADEGLLHAELDLPAVPVLRFPRWIPGTHAPSNPPANLVGLAVAGADGGALAWDRDPRDIDRFRIRLPPATGRMRVRLTYIANQPTENSRGVDAYGSATGGLVNWNTCLLHPEDADQATLVCRARLRLPAGWAWASALTGDVHDGTVVFAPATLEELVDRPVLLAPQLSRHRLLGSDGFTAALTVAGTQPFDDAWLHPLSRLPDQTLLLFGGAWTPRHDVLVLHGPGRFGLEHAESGVVGMPPAMARFARADLRARAVLPHELAHAWIGKRRRPEGMRAGDLRTPIVGDGLWVYEGLTQYVGLVLATRSGLMTPAAWRHRLAGDLDDMGTRSGRQWRSLRDCCRSTHLLRVPARKHHELRRGQDYYQEGALFWLAADLRLRRAGSSLDAFCQAFFGPQGDQRPSFTETELVAALTALASDEDWAARIARWIDGTGDLPPVLDGSGWRLVGGRKGADETITDEMPPANQGFVRRSPSR
jgi:predicted metalloprotease with PDZ domain